LFNDVKLTWLHVQDTKLAFLTEYLCLSEDFAFHPQTEDVQTVVTGIPLTQKAISSTSQRN
jgi:hypothetical protein